MKKSSNKFVSPVKSTANNINNNSNNNTNKFISPSKTTTTTLSKNTKPEIPTPTKTFKKSSSGFQTPTKTTSSISETKDTTNTTPIKTPTRKSGSSFQTPTKLTFQTPNDKDESPSSSSSSSSSSSFTSSSISITKSPIEIFKTIPQYIQQYLDKYIENDKEKKELKSIVQYSYENWNNNPFNYNDLINYNNNNNNISLNEDNNNNNNNNKDYIKKLIIKLVENNILKEIIINGNNEKVVKVYSSIPWYKVTSHHYLEMEIKRFEKEQQREEQQNTNINNKYNKIAPKNSTASIVATLSPSKPKSSGNHLSNSPISSSSLTPNKKRKPPIAFNLNEIDNSDFDSSKKFKKVINEDSNINSGRKNTILSSKYELQIERELQNIADEKKRILKSITDKKQLLSKFQSKSNSPVSEQKKTIPTSAEEKRIDDLILKWKKGCQDATTLLQEKLVETLAQSSSCNSGSVSGGGISGYYGYGNDESDYHGNDEDDKKDYGEFSEYEIQEYKEQMKLAREPISATKLYILKQFGVDPKFVNLDEENDCFLKEGELLNKTSSTNSKIIKKK
ncbi:hypothetical protein ACTFIU_010366 [Dictyostelium citrinum]